MQMFTLQAKLDHILLSFQNGTQFGYLRDNMTDALKPHLTSEDLVFEAVASSENLRARIAKAEKQADAIVNVDINIYGPRERAKAIGEELSDKKVWLQKPDYYKREFSYENPHLIRFPDLEHTVLEDIVQEVQSSEPVPPQPVISTVEEMITGVYRELHRADDLDREDGDQRLKTQLLEYVPFASLLYGTSAKQISHQRRGLTFMLQRETGNIPGEFRLWRPALYEGQEMLVQPFPLFAVSLLILRRFIHCITKQRSTVQPDERGGGVLADEMGMGKSLAVLALVIRTLERAREWAEEHRLDEHTHSGSYTYSHSTLVIVPSARTLTASPCSAPSNASQVLINGWETEIRKWVPPQTSVDLRGVLT